MECRLQIPLNLVSIELPKWAEDCGVNGNPGSPRKCFSRSKFQTGEKLIGGWLRFNDGMLA